MLAMDNPFPRRGRQLRSQRAAAADCYCPAFGAGRHNPDKPLRLIAPSIPAVLCKDALFSHRPHTYFLAITLKHDFVSGLDTERVTNLSRYSDLALAGNLCFPLHCTSPQFLTLAHSSLPSQRSRS